MNGSKRPRLQSPPRVEILGNEDDSDQNLGMCVDESSEEVDKNTPLAGWIESLHMENFMCHKNLEIVFNKRVTFVTGKNGSGKSAIMAALVVALGGSANITGRGTGIIDLIKKGATWARVTITLRNVGTNTYKSDIYGNKIIITRTFTKANASTYVCKAENGTVISRKKEEVDKITTVLDLQYKNPVCILNQDTARSFLSTGDSRTRFKMLMDATHLQDIEDHYAESVEMLRESQKQIDEKIVVIDKTKKEIDYLQEKLDYFASLEKYKKDRVTLEHEYAWSLVTEEEKILQSTIDKKSELEKKITDYTENESKLEESINKLMQEIKETQRKISNSGNDQTVDKEKKKNLEAEIEDIKCKIVSVENRLKQFLFISERQKTQINTIKENLEKNENLTGDDQLKRNEIADRLKHLRRELSEVTDRIETAQRDSDNAANTKAQHNTALDNLQPDLCELQLSKKILQVQAGRAVTAVKNAASKFGPFTVRLRELINQADKMNQFQRKPVGPCGPYVTLSGDNKWARAIENLVGALMVAYCCDNRKDFQVLTLIMDKICGGKNPPIIVCKFKNSRHKMASENISGKGCLFVLDVLHFTDDIVFNTFIDQARINSTVLFETDTEAAALMSNALKVPKNVKMGITRKGDQYYPAPSYRTYHGEHSRPLKYFVNPATAKDKDTLDKEIQKVDLSLMEKTKKAADLKHKLNQITVFLKRAEHNLCMLKQNRRKVEHEFRSLKSEQESYPILQQRMVLEAELETLENSQAETEKKINTEKQAEEGLLNQKAEKDQELGKIIEIEEKLMKEISDLKNKLEEFQNQLSDKRKKKGSLGNKIKDAKLQLSELSGVIDEKNKLVADKIENASKIHQQRIVTDRPSKEVKKLLEKCKNYLRVAERHVSQKEAILAEFNMKMKRYKEAKESSEFLKVAVAELMETLVERRNKLCLLRKHMTNLVIFHFQACLKTRGYTGHLSLDYEKQKLNLSLTSRDGITRSDTKTLSGGEKSYSTISLILAIWRAVHMPFYFLDEFDVFMDKVNRKVILDLLMDHAMDEKRMQFIFITPQDISSIQSSDSVEIYRMPDPRD